MRVFLNSALLVLLAGTADAATVPPSLTVNAYLRSCEVVLARPYEEIPAAAPCSYYMAGVGDAFTSHLLQPFACAPFGVGNMDVIKAFVAWARKYPDLRGEHVFRGVVAALSERYPCPKPQ